MHKKTIVMEIDKPLYEVIDSVQYDRNSRFVHVKLLNNSLPFDLTNKRIILSGSKPNGEEIFNTCKIEEDLVVIEITEDMNAVPGVSEYSLEIYGGDMSLLQTKNFKIEVTPSVRSKKVESRSEVKALTDALSEVQNIDNRFAETNAQLSETKQQLEQKASKDDIANISSGTPLFSSSIGGMTDTTKNYVNTTDGYLYVYSGEKWNKTTVQYQSTGISDKSVTSIKTDFLDQKNLVVFGDFISGKKIQGDAGSGMSLLNDVNYHILAINVKTNTTYTLVLPEDLGLEDGYYWLKVATSTQTKEDILNNFSNFYTFDGGFKYTKTDGYLRSLWVNTGANDKCIFIQLSKYKKPTYLEFLEDKVNGRMYSSYIDSAFPLFNCYSKVEVDNKLANIGNDDNKIFVTKADSGTYVTIYYKYLKGYIGYRYGVYGDGAINLNTYRLIDIKTYDFEFNPQYIISDAPYDNEGVLKVKGEADYIGGVHGDEKSPILSVFIDNKMVNFTDIPSSGIYCDEIKFIVASDIYHCDNQTSIAFKKTKQTYFDKDGVHINNKWIAQHTIELEHVRACLLSVNKVDSTTKLIDYYYDDKVVTTPTSVPAVNDNYTILATDKNINNVFLTGLIQCQVWGVRGGNDSELYSQITDFGSRIKPYFDCYTGRTVNTGDVLACQNNFNIKYN